MPPCPTGKRAQTRRTGIENRNRALWMKDFFIALAETSNVTEAAAKARITTANAYRVRREDPEFARKWQGALCEGYDNLEMELLQRLRGGIAADEAGRKFDNGAALRLLSAHRDSVSRQRALRDNEDAAQITAAIDAKIEAMRQRALAAGEDVWAVPGDGDGDGDGDGGR